MTPQQIIDEVVVASRANYTTAADISDTFRTDGEVFVARFEPFEVAGELYTYGYKLLATRYPGRDPKDIRAACITIIEDCGDHMEVYGNFYMDLARYNEVWRKISRA